MYTIKARIVEKPKATPQDILTLLPTQGPIGISIDMDEKFSLLEDNVSRDLCFILLCKHNNDSWVYAK